MEINRTTRKTKLQILIDRILAGVKVSKHEADQAWREADLGKICPPKFGGCPMMFRYIPPGETVICSSCGKTCRSLNITL